MSAVIDRPATEAGSIREQFSRWTEEDRETVFLLLLDQLLADNSAQAFIPLSAGDGVDRGYLVTPLGAKIEFDAFRKTLTPAQQSSLAVRSLHHNSISSEEMLEQVREIERGIRS